MEGKQVLDINEMLSAPDETIQFDTIRIKEFIENETTVSIVVYLVTIVLYGLSFVYLFKGGAAEYIVWIMLFILSMITPLLWAGDMFGLFEILSRTLPEMNKNIFLYGVGSLVAGTFILIITLFLVMMKNDEIRKVKTKQGHYKDTSELPDLSTKLHSVKKNDRIIDIMFTTVVTLIWGIVGFNFGEYLSPENVKLGSEAKMREQFPFGSRIQALLTAVPTILSWIDKSIQSVTKVIPLPPLSKAMVVYAITFVVVFFGIFAKIKVFDDLTFGRVEVTNMTPLFPPRYYKEEREIRHFVIILLTLLIGGVLYECMNSVSAINGYIKSTVLSIATIVMFAVFFSKEKDLFPTEKLQDIIFFFLCVLFGVVGAAPFTAIIESLARFIPNMYLGSSAPFVYTVNVVVITAITFMVGMSDDWIELDGKMMKMFLATLITMTIALFMALSTEYSVFKGTYDFVALIIRFVMKYLAPIAVLILSILTSVYAHKNYNAVKNRANDDIIADKRVETEDDTQKKKNISKDQNKVKSQISSALGSVYQFMGIKDKNAYVQNYFG